jgi:hypothetical protein
VFLFWLSNRPNAIPGPQIYIYLECLGFACLGLFILLKAAESYREFDLYKKTIGSELVVDDAGLRISIGFIAGPLRVSLRKSGNPYLVAKFEDIASWRIPPPRGGTRGPTRWYEIKLRSRSEKILLARKPLKDAKSEANFVDILKSKLPVTIELNDSLDY